MALFKIFKGNQTDNLLKPILDNGEINEFYRDPIDGYAYYDTSTKLFYIDADYRSNPDPENPVITRQPINAAHAGIAGNALNGIFYGICKTAASTKAKVAKLIDDTGFVLAEGTIVLIKFENAATSSTMTLNVNGTGAKTLYQYGTTLMNSGTTTTGWIAGAVVPFVYTGTGWHRFYWSNTTYTITSVDCLTAAGTADKVSSNSVYYTAKAGNIFECTFRYGNTAASALTLNINKTGAKPIYINGEESSASNYTLPAGKYIVYYDGENYYFNTNGKAPIDITGNAATADLATKATQDIYSRNIVDTYATKQDVLDSKNELGNEKQNRDFILKYQDSGDTAGMLIFKLLLAEDNLGTNIQLEDEKFINKNDFYEFLENTITNKNLDRNVKVILQLNTIMGAFELDFNLNIFNYNSDDSSTILVGSISFGNINFTLMLTPDEENLNAKIQIPGSTSKLYYCNLNSNNELIFSNTSSFDIWDDISDTDSSSHILSSNYGKYFIQITIDSNNLVLPLIGEKDASNYDDGSYYSHQAVFSTSKDDIIYTAYVYQNEDDNHKSYLSIRSMSDSATTIVNTAISNLNSSITAEAGKAISGITMTNGKITGNTKIDIGETNQNAFSNIKIGSATIKANSKTDTFELFAGTNVTFSPDINNKKITINATDTTYTAATTNPPNINTTGSYGSVFTYARGDHTHAIDLTTGDNNGEVKIAGQNIKVKGLTNAAYKNITDNTTTTQVSSTDDNLITARTLYNAGYLSTSGGVMSGSISSNITPTADAHLTNKQYVDNKIASSFAANDAMIFKGILNGGSTTTYTPAADKGHTYKVATAGKINNINVEVGDVLICLEDSTVQATSSNVNTIKDKWVIVQTNLDGAVIGPTSAINGNVAVFDTTSGKLIRDGGYSIAANVPANAKFTDTTYTAGTGLTLDGTQFKHINSVAKKETLAVYPITIDTEGHITSYGAAQTILTLGHTAETAFPGNEGIVAYTHATNKGSAFTSGLYKITTNNEGHVTEATAVTKADITALGIPAENTNTDTKVNVKNRGVIKSWLLADQQGSPSASAVAHEAVADPNIYMDTSAGAFAATSYKVAEAVTLTYDATTQALNFVFA